jgi:DNA-binding MarR family transcriptional regulator
MRYGRLMTEPLSEPDADPPARLWRQTSWLLNQATARANRIVAEHFGTPGGRMRYGVLAGLEQYGPLSQAELSRRLGIDRGDLVSALNLLQREGLAQREQDPRDSRRNQVFLTEAGRAALYAMDGQVTAAQEELVRELPEAEREHLHELLRLLLVYPWRQTTGEAKAVSAPRPA